MEAPLTCDTHCISCILLQCVVPVDGCQFVSCPNACGANMHVCKVADHVDEVCIKTVVACINRELGCTLKMERGKLREHLPHCPASVVLCDVPCSLPNRHLECPSVKYEEVSQGRSISPFVPPISPAPPLPEIIMAPISSGPAKHVLSVPSESCYSNTENLNAFVKQPLTPILRTTKLCTLRPVRPQTEQFSCARLIPRAEAEQHYRFHSEFLHPLNAAFELRCPLHRLGCEFVALRMLPQDEQHQLMYHPQLDLFTVRRNESSTISSTLLNPTEGDTDASSMHDTELPNLNTLPVEIIQYLSQFLDDISLFILSKVSHRLWILLNPTLQRRMVVTPRWQQIVYPKCHQSRWKIDRFVWSFPHRTEKLTKWHWLHSGTEISEHLKTCPFNDIVVQDQPFCLITGTQSAT